MGSWKQLYSPEEWKECKDPQLVNLGSGRLCIARFFHARSLDGGSADDIDENVAVFTGVEVVPRVHYEDADGGSGEVGAQVTPHKSLCHKSNAAIIDAVF